MAQCHVIKAPDGAFGGFCARATRVSLSSPCQVGSAEWPLLLALTPVARPRVQSLFHLSSPASPGCLAHRLPVDLGCRTDKAQQTATVFTMVGLEAAGVLNVLEGSWLANAPRLKCHCHLNGASYFFSTQSRMPAHSLLLSVPCSSFMGRTVPGDKWHNTITTR